MSARDFLSFDKCCAAPPLTSLRHVPLQRRKRLMQIRCGVVTRQAAYTTAVRLPNFYIKRVMRYATLRSCRTRLRRPAGRLTSFMQKSGSRISPDTPPAATRGSVMSLRGLFVPRSGKIASAKAQAEKNASGCPPARRTRLVCDCSSLSPLTLKPLRSPTPCPFTAIATAFNVRLRRTRGNAVNGHGYGGFGAWLQRRQPSTMSAGFFLDFDTCRAPPPSRSLRGLFVRRSTAFERTL